MASGLVPQEEPFPWRGLNDAVSPVNLEPGFATEAHNVVLTEPGAVRPRFGWKRGDSFYTIDVTWSREVPVGYFRDPGQPGSTVLHTYAIRTVDTAGVGTWGTGRDIDGVNLRASGYITATNGVSAPVAMPSDATTYNLLPYGHPHWYLDKQFSVSVGRNFTRWMGFSATTSVTGRYAVVVWNGSGTALQTRTATINNGSTAGTTTVALTGDVTDMFMLVTDATGGEVAGHKYLYEVYSSGGLNFTLKQPYGLGDSATDVPNLAGKTVTFMPIGYLPNAPDAKCVAVWRDRIWAVGGTLNSPPATTSPLVQVNNVLCWSEPTDYNRWPAANYIQLDDNEGILAMAATNDALWLFSKSATQVITGTDESNFQRVTLYNDLGCLHPSGVYSTGDVVYVMDPRGVYRLSLGGRENLVRPDTTSGIPNAYRALWAGTSTFDDGFDNETVPWITVHRDNLFLTIERVLGPTDDTAWTDAKPYPLVYNMSTGAWSTWGTTNRREIPNLLYARRDIPTSDPDGNTVSDWRLWGAGRTGMFYLDHCWDDEPVGPTSARFTDERHADAGATASTNVAASFTTRDFMFADGQTTRVQTIQVEHGCQASVSSVLPWTVTLDYDQDIDSSSVAVGTITARVQNPASRSRYYTDTFTDVAFPTEGMVFRTRYAFAASTALSGKLYRQRFHVLRAPTKSGRVDNT
jgi:hypothetical protein